LKTFIVDIEIYDCKIHVLNNFTDDEFKDYVLNISSIEKIERTESVAAFWTIPCKNKKNEYVLDLKKKIKKDGYSLNTICHECTHATFDIMKWVNIPYVNDATDEAYCCLNAFIFQKVYEGIFK